MSERPPLRLRGKLRPRRSPRWRPGLPIEALEPRSLLSVGATGDLVLRSATTTDSRSVTVVYDVAGAALDGPLSLEIDRSATAVGTGSDVLAARASLATADLGVGTHTIVVPIPGGLTPDPSHPYVRAVANADRSVAEADSSNDTAAFRIDTVAAVVGGVEDNGATDPWAVALAGRLRAVGYDAVGQFQWHDRGDDPATGRADEVAAGISSYVETAAGELTRSAPGDVVDVQLIGAGRGAVAASLAMDNLGTDDRTPAALRQGWHVLTLLDPTAARPGAALPGGPGPLGRLARVGYAWFDAVADDPAVTIPADVDQADVYYERSRTSTALDDRLGAPVGPLQVPVLGASAVSYYDATAQARGTNALEQAYLARVAPTLGGPSHGTPLGRLVTPAVAARDPWRPGAGKSSASATTTAAAYDRRALVRAIPSRPLAHQLFAQLAGDAQLLGRPDRAATVAALQSTFAWIAQRPAVIPDAASTDVLTVLAWDLAALTGDPPPTVPGVEHAPPKGAPFERPTAPKTVPSASSDGNATPAANNATPAANNPTSASVGMVDLSAAFLDSANFAAPFRQVFEDCSANSLAGAIDYLIATNPSLAALDQQGFEPSRLFIYYNTRFLEGDTTQDEGTFQGDAIKVAANQGLTSEGTPTSDSTGATLPYPTTGGGDQYAVNPGAANYATGPLYRISDYAGFPQGATLADMQNALNHNQVFTFWVNADSFPDQLPAPGPGQFPTVPPPPDQTPSPDGGHFMLAVGYDNTQQAFIVRNSWGDNWGYQGFAYLPYSYFTTDIPDYGYTTTWALPEYTVNALSVLPPPVSSINTLSQVVSLPDLATATGQVHIDAAPAAGNGSGTAAAFNYDNAATTSQPVTPLLFSYDATSGLYTLQAIGQSSSTATAGAVGAPFVAIKGNASVTATSAFGFYDGQVMQNNDGQITQFVPAAATIPYDTSSGTGPWLSTDASPLSSLSIGETFSLTNSQATVPLAPAVSSRTYAAMLVMNPS